MPTQNMIRSAMILLTVSMVLAVGTSSLSAGEIDAAASDSTDAALGESRTVIAPLPVIFYTPETKTAFGAVLNIFRRGASAGEDSRPSTFSPIFIYTTKGQIISLLQGNHYWDEERNQILGALSYSKFPDAFYGLGNDTAEDGDEEYTAETYGVDVSYLREIRPALWLGGGVSVAKANILETELDGLMATGAIPGSEGGVVVGLSVSTSYDNRDDITYPRAGGLHSASFRVYDGALGSDFDFRNLWLDSRLYHSFGERSVVAFRALGGHTDGRAPFQLLPALGGDVLLRGYFGGRFRDRDLVVAEAEWRQHLWRRLGGVVFGGVGQVAHNPGEFSTGEFHGSAGFGLRVLLLRDEGLNLRFDFGFGEDSSGSYLSLGEAF